MSASPFEPGAILQTRAAGVLLHLSSLAGPHGIGDLGPGARAFVDVLSLGGQRIWQMLPVNALGDQSSPYSAISSFAGEPRFIHLADLCDDGLLMRDEVPAAVPCAVTDFALAERLRAPCIEAAFVRFSRDVPRFADAFGAFRAQASYWLEDFAVFEALRRSGFTVVPSSAAFADAHVHVAHTPALAALAARVKFEQFVFDNQWRRLHDYARQKRVALMGDVPIFVAEHSADVVAHAALFKLDSAGRPRLVSGVPPDYFSELGQRWGTPVYDVEALAADGYRYFTARFRSTLARFDVARIDHFVGFVNAWEIPAESSTAVNGTWVPGPGRPLFDAARAELGVLPLLAEDLGATSDAVCALRDGLGFPGMRVLQFAFGSDARDPFLPHNYAQNTVAYTGTHDNDTWLGFRDAVAGQKGAPREDERVRAAQYLGIARNAPDAVWCEAGARALYASVANTAILPVQDLLLQGSASRMNVPGTESDNFVYRMPASGVDTALAAIAPLARIYGRD